MPTLPRPDDDGRIARLVPQHSITNQFVGLSQANPIGVYTFPYTPGCEATLTDEACADRQKGITSRYLANLDVLPHDHEFYEITLVRGGRAIHYTDYAQAEVGAGSVVVAPPGVPHAFTELDALAVTNIYYQSEWLSENLRSLLQQEGLVALFLAADLFAHPQFKRVFHFSVESDTLAACIHELREICAGSHIGAAHSLFVAACFLKLLILLSRDYCRTDDSIAHIPFCPETWAVLEEMEDALVAGRPFSFSAAAERLGLSSRHLSLLFLRDVGQRPSSFFLRRRVQHAARMLILPNQTVTDVAYALGFSNPSHFCNQFKQLYGMTPTAYRKRFFRTG